MSPSVVVADVVGTRGQKLASWQIVQSQSKQVEVVAAAILQGAALVCRMFDWNVPEVNARASRSPVPPVFICSPRPWEYSRVSELAAGNRPTRLGPQRDELQHLRQRRVISPTNPEQRVQAAQWNQD